jgi:hypothetical protein
VTPEITNKPIPTHKKQGESKMKNQTATFQVYINNKFFCETPKINPNPKGLAKRVLFSLDDNLCERLVSDYNYHPEAWVRDFKKGKITFIQK